MKPDESILRDPHKPWCRIRPDEAVLRDLYEVQRLSTREIGKRFDACKTLVLNWLKAYGIERRYPSRGLLNRGIVPPSKEELHRMIHVEYLGYRGVAARYGVDHSAVAHWLRKHGIKAPKTCETQNKTSFPKLDPLGIRQLYEAGISLEEIGDRLGVSEYTIARRCREHGIEIKPDGFENGRRYVCDDGSQVRSSYEQRVANWLISRNLVFTYEPTYPFPRRTGKGRAFQADFLVNGWYIEIWGVVKSERYKRRKDRKIRLCELHGLPLIQLIPGHFLPRHAHVMERILLPVLSQAIPRRHSQGLLF